LERGQADGFWANALGSETAVRRGVGRIIVDVRRGDGPRDAGQYTFAALTTTEGLIAREPDRVAAAGRGGGGGSCALKGSPARTRRARPRSAGAGFRQQPPRSSRRSSSAIYRSTIRR